MPDLQSIDVALEETSGAVTLPDDKDALLAGTAT
jgi:hypothetical protein